MITKINKIKKFGIFKDFVWNNSIDTFKNRNLIFGWNYSGKTTLSKLFQILEFKDKNKYFSGSEIEISINDNGTIKPINQDSLASFPFITKVFNSEFTKRIFTWDEPKEGFNPIAFYLGDPAGDLKAKIKKLEIINERLLKLRDNKYKYIVDTFENYNKQNGKFTDKAKDIRDNYLPGLYDPTTFNKSELKRIADVVKYDLAQYILTQTDRDAAKAEATAIKKYEKQRDNIQVTENLKSLAEKVKNILEDSAPKSISFPNLDEDSALFDWVQKGIPLHQNSSDCKFCTKPLPENRLEDLNSYYSKKLQEIQNAITKVQKEISAERDLLKITFPSKREITETYQKSYEEATESFNETKKEYEKQLSILESDLKNKGSNIFNSIPPTPIVKISFEKDFNAIETHLKNHNLLFDKFEERKDEALVKIINHYVAEYLNTEKYNQKETDKNSANQTIGLIDTKIQANELLIDGYNAQLSNKVKGQSELNNILEILLHRDDIKIEIRNDKFTLERSGHPATDLSEGEKSAIAFSYFLTELKALRDDDPSKLPKTIIFIDDPISSLDSNHIFQVRSLLKDFFRTDDFAQLFVSTHNFEFFSIMYDSKIFSQTKKEVNRPLYFIKRDQAGASTIEKMPKTFSDYKSEYVGLFFILKNFHESLDKENFPYLILLPNALRRFVELYTLSKYPGNNESTVDQRVEIVFKSEDKPYHNIKLLNWFSHQNQMEKLQRHDDKIIQVSDAINDLIEYLKKHDELHWKGLNGI
ncbi:MAG: AAA family ATPase [bacterium]|nr:AAA family ATPase [bacterium]